MHEAVPARIQSKWNAWIHDLMNLLRVCTPRCVVPSGVQDMVLELHHFSDASMKSYGYCSYLRGIDRFCNVHASLLMSKNKVAPLKNVIIPRLCSYVGSS